MTWFVVKIGLNMWSVKNLSALTTVYLLSISYKIFALATVYLCLSIVYLLSISYKLFALTSAYLCLSTDYLLSICNLLSVISLLSPYTEAVPGSVHASRLGPNGADDGNIIRFARG